MNKTFYAPEKKREAIDNFIKAVEENEDGKSYSSVIVELMEEYTSKMNLKKIGR